MVPVPIKRKGPRVQSLPACPHWVLGYMGPEGQGTFQQKHQNSWNLVPSLGPARGWPCAHLAEPFPHRRGQVSCPEGAELTPRQKGAGSYIGGGGAHSLVPTSATLGPRGPFWGQDKARGQRWGSGCELGGHSWRRQHAAWASPPCTPGVPRGGGWEILGRSVFFSVVFG